MAGGFGGAVGFEGVGGGGRAWREGLGVEGGDRVVAYLLAGLVLEGELAGGLGVEVGEGVE